MSVEIAPQTLRLYNGAFITNRIICIIVKENQSKSEKLEH